MNDNNQLHIESSKNKWASPRTLRQIEDMEAILDILQNPYMNALIQNMGLAPETLSEIHEKMGNIYFADELLTANLSDKLSSQSQMNIADVAQKNGIPDYFELVLLFRKGGNEFLLTRNSPIRRDDDLSNSIKDAKEKLAELKKVRDEECKHLHLVNIVLPQSLLTLNDMKTITEAARDVLLAEFNEAVKMNATNLIQKDAKSIRNELPPTSNWMGRVRGWVKKMANHLTSPSFAPSPILSESNYPQTLQLELAAVANIGADEPERLALLQPLFLKAAKQLSGSKLTQKICEKLKPDTQPSQEAAPRQTYDWIKVLVQP